MINLEKEIENFEKTYNTKNNGIVFDKERETFFFEDISYDDSKETLLTNIRLFWVAWLDRASIAHKNMQQISNEKLHAELVCDSAIEEISRLKAKLAKYESEEVVVVPRIPTKEMLSEFPEVKANDTYTGDFLHFISDEEISSGYKAMIEIGEIK